MVPAWVKRIDGTEYIDEYVPFEAMLCAVQEAESPASSGKGDTLELSPMRLPRPLGQVAEHAVSSVAQRGLLAARGVVRARLLVDDAVRNERCL